MDERSWFELAGDRPWMSLWGKARPSGDADVPAHPLLFHMLDVAAVAEALVGEVLPPRIQRALLEPFGGPDDDQAPKRLAFLVGTHDLGKASPAFQIKWKGAKGLLAERGFDLEPPATALDHGTLSGILVRCALVELDVEPLVAYRLARAVAAHHGIFPPDSRLMARLGPKELGRSPLWAEARRAITKELRAGLGLEGSFSVELPENAHAFIAALAGLVSVADWIGSMEEAFPYASPGQSVKAYRERSRSQAKEALQRLGMTPRALAGGDRSFEELFRFAPSPLQAAAERIAGELDGRALVLIEAPMGEGKTEAALHLAEAGSDLAGFFVGLPTQATANQILGRVKSFLENTRQSANLQLVHGDAGWNPAFQALVRGVYDQDEREGAVHAEAWFTTRKRALLAEHAVGTIDQALLGVLRTKHGFVRLFGLAGKTVVLDEVHAYDTYTSEILERLVAWLAELGANVVMLSATLPSKKRRRLLEAFAGREIEEAEAQPYPRVTVVTAAGLHVQHVEPRRRSAIVRLERIGAELEGAVREIARRIEPGGCAGLILNTVKRSQAAMGRLLRMREQGLIAAETELILLHSRFPLHARNLGEQRLEGLLGPEGNRPTRAIVVGTQVLEQSLDIDFDLLATDVAPIDLVLQRAGRLHRHERPQRPRHLSRPSVLVLLPGEEGNEVDLREVAGVYDEWVVRKTLRVLEGREEITIPDELEELIEGTYSDEAAEDLEEARASWEKRELGDALMARGRVLPSPRSEDDPFSDFGIYFEDDPAAHEALRAQTRLGGPSLELICLAREGDTWSLGPGDRAISLEDRPDPELLEELLGRKVPVSNPGLVRRLRELRPSPPGWQKTSRLRSCVPIAALGAGESIGGYHLRLDDVLGLVIERNGST